jgi:hypothetical protein
MMEAPASSQASVLLPEYTALHPFFIIISVRPLISLIKPYSTAQCNIIREIKRSWSTRTTTKIKWKTFLLTQQVIITSLSSVSGRNKGIKIISEEAWIRKRKLVCTFVSKSTIIAFENWLKEHNFETERDIQPTRPGIKPRFSCRVIRSPNNVLNKLSRTSQ